MSQLKIKVDSDIIDILDSVEQNSRSWSLFLYNDDFHNMLEVAIQIMVACKKVGVPCKADDAYEIMMEAHSNGIAVVMVGELDKIKTAKDVLDSIQLNTEIQ